MSAFSNWNGPDCGHGPSLPQIQTLEQLITQVNNLQAAINGIASELQSHESDDGPNIPTTLHRSIQAALNRINGFIGTWNDGTIAGKIAALQTSDANKASSTDLSNEITRATGVEGGLQTAINGVPGQISIAISNHNTASTAHADIRALITDINNYLAGVKGGVTSWTGSLITLQANLKALDVTMGKLWLSHYLDFDVMTKVAGYIFPDTETPSWQQGLNGDQYTLRNGDAVVLLGMLSEDYRNAGDKPIGPYKPGRVYIKYLNTQKFDAIVDAAVTYNGNGAADKTNYTGVVNALASKTVDRTTPITFGLYMGTDATGNAHVYIGVVVQEAQGIYVTSNGAIAGLNFLVAGENVIPLNKNDNPKGIFPVGAVHRIASAILGENVPGSMIVSEMSIGTVYSDNYRDAAGHGVAITDEANGKLTIGDAEALHDLAINTGARPTVNVNGGLYQMGFLEDLAQSAYFQKDVAVIVQDLNELNTNCLVTVDASGKLVTWQPTPSAGYSNVPGIYTTDRATPNPTGIIFKTGDQALLKDGGSKSPDLADGFYNGVGPTTSTDVPLTSISGFDKNKMKPSNSSSTTAFGTLLRDTAGNIFVIQYDHNTTPSVDVGYVTIAPFSGTPPFGYTLPAYYELKSDGTWGKVEDILVPGEYDGYVNAITYTWNGYELSKNVIGGDVHYVNTTAFWTAQYENSVTMNYDVTTPSYENAWSFNDTSLDGFRNLVEQNYIDDYLQELAEVQPDWAEEATTIQFARPEQAEKTIPNPAFIQHKPWTGVALLDGGGWYQPDAYYGWVVTGCDFRDITISQGAPVIAPNDHFRDVIQKIMYGDWNSMPETVSSAVNVQTMFARTWRLVHQSTAGTDSEAYLSDVEGSANMFRFVPINNYKYLSILQDFRTSVDTAAGSSFTLTMNGTDLTQPFNAQQYSVDRMFKSDVTSIRNGNNITLALYLNFAQTAPIGTGDITITSPALDAEIAARQDEVDNLQSQVTGIQNQIDGSANPPVYNATNNIAAAIAAEQQARIDLGELLPAGNFQATPGLTVADRINDAQTAAQTFATDAVNTHNNLADSTVHPYLQTQISDVMDAVDDVKAVIPYGDFNSTDTVKAYIDAQIPAAINTHNGSGSSHMDIRDDIVAVKSALPLAEFDQTAGGKPTVKDYIDQTGQTITTLINDTNTKLGGLLTANNIPTPPAGTAATLHWNGTAFEWV